MPERGDIPPDLRSISLPALRSERHRTLRDLRRSTDQRERRHLARRLLTLDQRLGRLQPGRPEVRARRVAVALWGERGARARGFGSTPPSA
jgi:hypothetical protein